MNGPSISVVVCVYNREGFIGNCLESLLSQTYAPTEIIVVDDGSTDGTPDILENYARSEKIKLLVNQGNMGLMRARNIGAHAATSEVVSYIDSDCLADKNWLLELARPFTERSGITISGGRISDPEVGNYWSLVMRGAVFVSRKSGYVPVIRGGNMAILREFLTRNPFDETLKYGADETDLCFRAIEQGKKIYYTEYSTVIHYHRNNMMSLVKQQFALGIANYYVRLKHGVFPYTSIKSTVLCLAIITFFLGYLHLFALLSSLYMMRILYEDFRPRRKTPLQIIASLPGRLFITLVWDLGNLCGIFKIGFLKIREISGHSWR